jgi:hypothetical protein
LLGFVLCGLVAARVSVVTGDINSVATLFTSDVYRTLKKSSRRNASSASFAPARWLRRADDGFASIIHSPPLPRHAVNINLFIVGLFDMPLFVIGDLWTGWRRANWQGVAGSSAADWPSPAGLARQPRPQDRPIVAASPPDHYAHHFAADATVRRSWRVPSMKANADDGVTTPSAHSASLIGKLASPYRGLLIFPPGVFAGGARNPRECDGGRGMLLVFVGGAVRVCSRKRPTLATR